MLWLEGCERQKYELKYNIPILKHGTKKSIHLRRIRGANLVNRCIGIQNFFKLFRSA